MLMTVDTIVEERRILFAIFALRCSSILFKSAIMAKKHIKIACTN